MTASSSAAAFQIVVIPLVLMFAQRTLLLGPITKVMLCAVLHVAIFVAIVRDLFVTLRIGAVHRGYGGSGVM